MQTYYDICQCVCSLRHCCLLTELSRATEAPPPSAETVEEPDIPLANSDSEDDDVLEGYVSPDDTESDS
jgi:hypothetical protein